MSTIRAVLLSLALVVAVGAAGVYARTTAPASRMLRVLSGLSGDTGWTVGDLRADGLRIIPTGRSDASAVLDPAQFGDSKVRHAYWIATQIPEVLNQLYCWCGCENRGLHRSNLQCFEDRMGVDCEVCRGTAEIAYNMTRRGITDARQIQAAVDAEWAPRKT